MRVLATLLAAAAALTMTGCTSILSLLPAVSDQEATMDSALEGTWIAASDRDKDDADVCTIVRGSGNAYNVTLRTDKETLKFEARLFRAGGAGILDMVTRNNGDPFAVSGHAFVRVWTGGNSLRWAFLDSDWLKKRAATMPAQTVDGVLVLTAPTSSIRDFLRANGGDDRAYSNSESFERLK